MTHNDLTVTIGREELVVRQRWETASIANDALIAIWFVIGSILFFWEDTTLTATWFFLVGSIQFLARPVIRLRRRIHLRRLRGDRYTDDAEDY
ncbi:YrhK family protein [Gordonia amicalis]|uniref:YrhK family protein n=1 Tax=Gordonia amicalis TaxID=89053 RepID=UPI0022B49E5E|nr:YrhK family protein [Gordonia amicalis]MCZ4580378.1 YrhK family protein [Gordonia amicalis]